MSKAPGGTPSTWTLPSTKAGGLPDRPLNWVEAIDLQNRFDRRGEQANRAVPHRSDSQLFKWIAIVVMADLPSRRPPPAEPHHHRP
jgi:hypothetical protein